MSKILHCYLTQIGVPHTKSGIIEVEKRTPYGNSVFGLLNMLKAFQLDANCVKYDKETDPSEITVPFIGLVNDEFILVKRITPETTTIETGSGDKTIPTSDFYTIWNRVALYGFPTEKSGEPDYKENRKKERLLSFKRSMICVGAFIIASIGAAVNPAFKSIAIWAALAVNLCGIYISYLLILKQLHISSPVAEKLCGISKHSHCDTVTSSDASSFLGLAKWSEIGAGFFTVNAIALLFMPWSIGWIAIAGICVLPFSIWSVWYQKTKAKSWCVLCLISLALMWLQTAAYWAGGCYSHIPQFSIATIAVLCAYPTLVLALNLALPVVERAKSKDMWQARYNQFKAKDEVILALEESQPELSVSEAEASSLLFGDPNATQRITVFSNPYCGPCADMHRRLENRPGADCCVQYVYTFFDTSLSDINKYIIAAYQQLGAERTWDLLTDWYAGGKQLKEEFFNGLELDINRPEVLAEFNKHRQWLSVASLSSTPTVLVNGHILAPEYRVEDTVYFPENL